jgi:hypothetical protein
MRGGDLPIDGLAKSGGLEEDEEFFSPVLPLKGPIFGFFNRFVLWTVGVKPLFEVRKSKDRSVDVFAEFNVMISRVADAEQSRMRVSAGAMDEGVVASEIKIGEGIRHGEKKEAANERDSLGVGEGHAYDGGLRR